MLHEATARRLSFGQLAAKAATLPAPTEPKLKSPKDFTLIGRPVHRIDGRAKVTGQAKFGIDAKVPGMLTAVIARPPVFGGTVTRFNADKAKAIPGVKRVVQIDTGIAVLADGFWPAKLGRDALEITWDDGPLATLDTVTQGKQYEELARLEGSAAAVAAARGNVASALATAEKKLEAVYELPYLAHADDGTAQLPRARAAGRRRDLGRHPDADHGSARRGRDRGRQAGAGRHPHDVPGRRLRASRQSRRPTS